MDMGARPERPSILVVDDEDDTRSFLTDLLSRAGYEVLAVSDAMDAYMEMAARRFDLVITDLRMPGVNGMELLSEVARISPPTKVILLTAYGDWEVYREALDNGALELVNKPFTNAELLKTVEWALSKAAA
jgi:DNA-binding NtrC family response regulator